MFLKCQEDSAVDDEMKKPLPLNRKAVEDYEYGFLEPKQAMRGRATLRQVMTFIGNHNAEPQTWTSEKISAEYKLKPSVVGMYIGYEITVCYDSLFVSLSLPLGYADNVLKHFLTFEVYIPDNKADKKDKVLMTKRLREMWDNKPKTLPPPKYLEDETIDRLLKEHDVNEKKREEERKDRNGDPRQIQ